MFLNGLGYGYAKSVRRDKALTILRELEERYAKGQATGVDLAMVYAGLEDNDQTIAWLEKDFETRNTTLLLFVAQSAIHERLRNDARYQDLLRRMGLEQVLTR